MVFNLVINLIFEAIQNARDELHRLGYADDTAAFEDSLEELQETLQRICDFLDRIGLELNVDKYRSIHIVPARATCGNGKVFIGDAEVPQLKCFKPTKYLGKPIGFRLLHDSLKMEDFLDAGTKILTSSLEPWQRIEALKTFFYPSLSYAMRTDQHEKGAWADLDKDLRKLIKDTLNLPKHAARGYIYGHTKDGCIGIPVTAFESEVARIDTAFKLLMSDDPVVKTLAWNDLKVAVRDRVGHEPSLTEMENFLNSSVPYTNQSRVSTVWTHARKASSNINVKWALTQDHKVTVAYFSEIITDKRKIFKTIKFTMRNEMVEELRKCLNQGKTNRYTSLDKVSNHFVRTGDYMRFFDWRFIHRARLNLVDLNGCKSYNSEINPQCRWGCEFNETLPHVVNHCEVNALGTKITDRHDRIVDRLRKASAKNWLILRDNQQYDYGDRLRPDLILTRKREEALIIDVAMPFEDSIERFRAECSKKEQKYAGIAE